MKIGTTLLFAALVATGGACKKKDKGSTETTDPGSGTPKANEGSATATKPETLPPAEKPLEGEALAKKYIACVGMINDSKFDEFQKDCVADDFKIHMAGMPDAQDATASKDYLKNMKAGFPDWKLTPQLVMINGRTILAVELSSGTHTADWNSPMGKVIPKTDKKFGVLMFHKLTINDANKASEEWAFEDPITMMSQLGLAPKEAGPHREALDKSWDGAPIVVVSADNDQEKAMLEGCKKADEMFNNHKADDMIAGFTDDGIESDQAMAKDAKGKKELEKGLKGFFSVFPDVKSTIDSRYAAGDWVIDIGSVTGTFKGAMGPIKPTGKSVTMEYAEVIKMKDGKVAELWRFRNGLANAMAMGLMKPADPNAKDGAAPAKDNGTAPVKDMKAPAKDKKASGW